MSYTNMLLNSSITAIFCLSAEISTTLIGVAYLTTGIGKPLSIKIFITLPFFNPTISPSLFWGPLIVLTYLIFESRIHSLSKMPEKDRS
jgi:hypothetical protein